MWQVMKNPTEWYEIAYGKVWNGYEMHAQQGMKDPKEILVRGSERYLK